MYGNIAEKGGGILKKQSKTQYKTNYPINCPNINKRARNTTVSRACFGVKYRMYFALLCGLLMVLFTGCSAEIPTVQEIGESSQPTTQETEVLQIIISHSQNSGTPEDFAAKAMQSKLQELLGTHANVILYADYQMGSAQEQLEALQLGRIHITMQSAAELSSFVEDMKVFTLPYLFSSDQEDVQRILDSALEKEALDRISLERGEPDFTGIGLWFGGYKLFTFSGAEQKAIHSPADFQGLKIAVPDVSLLKAQYRQWGAEPVPVEDIARYSVLEQNIAQGSEATISQIASNYLYEVQHNIVQAYHSAEIYVVLANTQWLAALPVDVQQAIIEAEDYGKQILYETLAAQEPAALDTITQAEGMHYEQLEEEQIAAFRTSVEPFYAEQLAGNPWQMQYVEKIKNVSRETKS